LSNFNFHDYFVLLPFIVFFLSFWVFFLKNNFYSVRITPDKNDVLKNSKFLKKVHHNFLINWNFINFINFLLFFYLIKLDFNSFWFNHLKVNNFLINILLIVIFISFFLIFLLKFLKNSNVNYNIDYFSSLFNLNIFIPLIFLSNNMYTFVFLLELNSILILYKFSVSRNWFKKDDFFIKNKNTFDRLLPKAYLNMLFFQYWANFFSTMLIMFSLFNIIYIYGSSEWFLINFLNYCNYNRPYNFNDNFFIFLWIPFFIGLFLKIGFTPLHLFKIEVYKGIPFISIFFYTTVYFLSFFLYFVLIILYNINSFKFFWSFLFFIFILTGILYTIILLFDVNLTKAFFAYSTIVNSLTFIIILFLSL